MRSLLLRSLVAALASCLLRVSVAQPTGCQAFYDNLSEPYDIATDSAGALYVADHGAQTVVKIASSGTGGAVQTYQTTSPALAYPDGLCLDSTGNVYVVDGNNQRVVKFNNIGQVQSVIASATTTSPPLNYPWNCAVDANNNVYISNTVGQGINVINANGTQTAFLNRTTPAFQYPNQIALDSATPPNLYVADSNNFHVVKINTQTGVQSQTVFQLNTGSYPNGVAVDSTGNVYVTDTVNGRVVVFNNAGANIYNLTTSNPPLRSPRGIWVDSSSNVFIADAGNARIVKFSTSGSNQCSQAPSTSTTVNGYNVASVYPSGTNFNTPYDVALDSSRNIYVADTNNNRVLKLSSGTGGSIQTTYTATPALNNPNGLCLDSNNNVYVVDTGNARVVKFTNGGQQSAVFSSWSPALLNPWNCVVDQSGNLYVSSTSAWLVNVANANGTQIAYYNVSSVYPNQIAIDQAGYLYVADSNDFRVVKVNTNTASSTPNGSPLPINATFNMPTGSYPNGVAVDTSGNVYVSDTTQASIYIFNAAGTPQKTLAAANFTEPLNQPRGLAVDTAGNIYVADSNNNRIVIFQTGGSNGASSVLQSTSWAVLVLAALLSVAFSL